MDVYNRIVNFAYEMTGTGKRISLGVCAMDKKARSPPMREILSRLPELFEVTTFGDECILNQPVEAWPVVECLIAFSSGKFPIAKALSYIALRKPFLINDLSMDAVLNDRRKVYELLLSVGIEVPKHVVLNREDASTVNVVEEFDEYIVVNGVQINKPLVEKPVDAEDHNIHIYYPVSAGGGSKRLFRKVNDRSSEFYPHVNELRTEGSYIYEEFVTTQGTDVKVYTVGPEYGHAEARKSPVVDGKVNRDSSGREVRYPVILSHDEKDIIRKIVTAFRQTVCGFDILRVRGKSFVCDVNGWSFVKNSRKYYDDASRILIELMMTALRPRIAQLAKAKTFKQQQQKLRTRSRSPFVDDRMLCNSTPSSISSEWPASDSPAEELRCVIAVLRHGDRTPKQKMKLSVTHAGYLEYFHQFCKSPKKDMKIKSKTALVRFLEVTKEILQRDFRDMDLDVLRKFTQIRDVLERWEISGINRKLQMKPLQWEEVAGEGAESSCRATELQMILKWGGDLTPLGREQAESEGALFRKVMYPDGGVLRLHSTYRHDLKIRASDEGRVMKTAAAFTKGLLELEGALTPILASLVTVEERDRQMLDKGGNFRVQEDMDRCKAYMVRHLQRDEELTDELIAELFPHCQTAMHDALQRLGNPQQSLRRMHELIKALCTQIEQLCPENGEVESVSNSNADASEAVQSESEGVLESDDKELYLSETYALMLDRWEKLNKDFKNKKTDAFDLTKVPDVYDMVRYDVLHNSHIGLAGIEELLSLVRDFADAVVPQEYGITREDKMGIGAKMCGTLIQKLKDDLEITMSDTASDMHFALDHSHAEDLMINSLERSVRTRLYFTSESHLHTLLNVLCYPSNDVEAVSESGRAYLSSVKELGYLTQIVIRLFESEVEGARTYRCEISFSPGAVNDPLVDKSASLAKYEIINKSITSQDLIRLFSDGSAAIDSMPAPVLEPSTPDAKSERPVRTKHETEVVGNCNYETTDTWEGCSPLRGRKINVRRTTSASRVIGFIPRSASSG